MIYDTLRKLPKVIQVEILETGDLSLLSDEKTPIEDLAEIWANLMEEFNQRYNKQEHNKLFNIYKEIEYLDNKYTTIHCAVDALEFDIHPELIEMLQGFGYRLTMDNYNEDLKRIERESEGIKIKIKNFSDKLPKPTSGNNNEVTIIDIMASYSMIAGYDFDYYMISVEKYHSLEKQIQDKVAHLEKQNAKNKKK